MFGNTDMLMCFCFLVTSVAHAVCWFGCQCLSASGAKRTETVITVMTNKSSRYTFFWLNVSIVEVWVFSQIIFRKCRVFFTSVNSLGLLCVSVGELGFRSDVTLLVVSVEWAEPLIHMFHSLSVRVCFSRCFFCSCCKCGPWRWETRPKKLNLGNKNLVKRD